MNLIDLFTAAGSINTRMHLTRINEENCYKALQAAKRRFMRSKAPARLKRVAQNVNPIIVLCGGRRKWLAAAYGVSVRARVPERQKLNLRESTTPYVVIGKKGYYMLIQVFPKSFSKLEMTSWSYLKRVIAHEWAHCVDTATERQGGYFTESDPATDHNEQWAKISLWSGGNDEPEIAYSR